MTGLKASGSAAGNGVSIFISSCPTSRRGHRQE